MDKRVQELVVFAIDGYICGLDVIDVSEIIRNYSIVNVAQSPEYMLGLLNLRGKIVSVLDVKKKFLLGESEKATNSGVLIVDAMGESMGLFVEAVQDVIKVKNEKFEDLPANFPEELKKYFTSVYKSDEQIIAVLNKSETIKM